MTAVFLWYCFSMNDLFVIRVKDYYLQHKREFPWRETTNPYFVFLSEICLQQTQTSRMILKFEELIKAFPTVESLATATFTHVLSHWSGLGYNRRAKYLLEAAKIIVEKYGGVFPPDPKLLDELPGVGFNTAAAIVVYSFNIPVAFIETNIRRVYIHHFFEGKEDVADDQILQIVETTIDRENPREWFWALMDYGAYLSKVVTNPNRRSKQYSRQSKFVGSVRQVRGSVLRILLNAPSNYETILDQVEGNKEHTKVALEQLTNERMVVLKDGLYSLV